MTASIERRVTVRREKSKSSGRSSFAAPGLPISQKKAAPLPYSSQYNVAKSEPGVGGEDLLNWLEYRPRI